VVIGCRYCNLLLLEQFSVRYCDDRGFVVNSMPDGVVIGFKRLQPITISVFRVRLQKPAVLAVFIRQSICSSALSDANYQLEGLEKHQKSSGLLASLMVTLFTVWV
jgi:hypothetical protein